ncbi:ORF35 [Ranid herpesvirus 2]|uniref:ORF35 n=1 Tax=Ranid herpesvirus 2 TaxID=389214 RepID=Q14W71_9VIRU|nr:ORF35 [Ranid herpesvirus 2]ABG25629.1 ORF35 [Ranid herpesvirus 2]
MFLHGLTLGLLCVSVLGDTYISLFEEYWPGDMTYAAKVYVNRTNVANYTYLVHAKGVDVNVNLANTHLYKAENIVPALYRQAKDVFTDFQKKSCTYAVYVMQLMFESKCSNVGKDCTVTYDGAVLNGRMSVPTDGSLTRRSAASEVTQFWAKSLSTVKPSNVSAGRYELTLSDYEGYAGRSAHACTVKSFFPADGHELKWLTYTTIGYIQHKSALLPNGDGTYTTTALLLADRGRALPVRCRFISLQYTEISEFHELHDSVGSYNFHTEGFGLSSGGVAAMRKHLNALLIVCVLLAICVVMCGLSVAVRLYLKRKRTQSRYKDMNAVYINEGADLTDGDENVYVT